MKKSLFTLSILTLSFVAQQNTVLAADQKYKSVTENDSSWETFKKNFGMNYSAEYYGSSVLTPFDSRQVDNLGEVSDSVTMLNVFTASYKLNDKLSVYADGRFSLVPVEGQGFELLNPRAGVSYKNLYENGNFSFSKTKAYLEAPASEAAQKKGSLISFALFQRVQYKVNDSGFTLGLDGQGKWFLYHNDVAANNLVMYGAPFVNYTFSDTVDATIAYEVEAQHLRNVDVFKGYEGRGEDLFAELAWQVHPQINIAPNFKVFPNDELGLKNSAVGFSLAAKLY